MLTLMQMPRLWVANPIGRPMRFLIQTDDHVVSDGAKATFSIEFQSGGGVNGDTIVIMDRTFTVDNSVPYTYNTFKANGTILQCAQNLMGAIQSNYWFQDFQVYLTSPGGVNWVVNAVAMTADEKDGWIFSEALTNTVVLADANGTGVVLARFMIWWRLYDEFGPVTEMRFANVPYDVDLPATSGRVYVDVEEVVRGRLKVRPPNMAQTIAQVDPDASGEFILRFGSVEVDVDNNRVFGASYQSSWFEAVNSVFQLNEVNEFKNHHPATIVTVKWLTNRPNSMSICESVYEWVSIWLDINKIVDQDFRVVYTFYDEGGEVVNTLTDVVEGNGFWVVPIGPANPSVAAAMTSDTVRYTVVVEGAAVNGDSDPVWVTYSETLTRMLINGCGCESGEFYFLEDKGSWRTVVFDEVEELREEVEKNLVQVGLDWAITGGNDRREYTEGERSMVVRKADGVFVMRSGKVTEKTRPMWEEFLRSKEVYMRSLRGSVDVIRRVIFESDPVVRKRGDVIWMEVAFRLNYERIVQ